MDELTLHPLPPNDVTDSCVVVLGRFQPLHLGHTWLIKAAEEWRLENSADSQLVLCIGSSNRPESMTNPWNYNEREEMIRSWLKNEQGFGNVKIVSIPDIDNPPMWVSHAEKYHGKGGSFFTSDSSPRWLSAMTVANLAMAMRNYQVNKRDNSSEIHMLMDLIDYFIINQR